MCKPVMLFIVEGEDRDLRFATEMSRCFMETRDDVRVVYLPAGKNIYMLYDQLVRDEFETDVVELLRESSDKIANSLDGVKRDSVDQIYLFFDYDPHQDNVPVECADDWIRAMIDSFDNEVENGKMYVSYPMVEALYDYRAGQCQSYSGCYIEASDIPDYKRISGEGNLNTGKHMQISQWKDCIASFVLRCKCLLDIEEMSFERYRDLVTVKAVFNEERRLLRKEGKVFALSAFPEFLLDYFGSKFFNSMAPMRNLKYDDCPHGVI